MSLADLVQRKKNGVTQTVANANTAKVAKVDPVLAVCEPRLAGLATLALAEGEQADFCIHTHIVSGTPANAGKHLSHYCTPGDCWCSAKLTGSGYPVGCVRIGCEHYQAPGAERAV